MTTAKASPRIASRPELVYANGVTIRQRTGAAVILVSRELPSLLAIADDGVFLDADSKRPIAHGSPRKLFEHCDHPTVHAFMRRGDVVPAAGATPIGEARP